MSEDISVRLNEATQTLNRLGVLCDEFDVTDGPLDQRLEELARRYRLNAQLRHDFLLMRENYDRQYAAAE
jgi:hypothetical protein